MDLSAAAASPPVLPAKPASVQDLLCEGMRLQAANSVIEARKVFMTALQAAPGDPVVLRLVGHFAAANGSAYLAEMLLRLAVQSDPHDIQTLFNHAIQLRRLHRLDEALECFGRVASIVPSLAPCQRQRAELFTMLAQDAEARAAWPELLAMSDDALAENPGDAPAGLDRALALRHLGREEESLAMCTRLVAEEACRDDEPLLQAAAAIALRSFEQAASDGSIVVVLKQFEELTGAIVFFRRTRAGRGTRDFSAFTALGQALRGVGQTEEAAACFEFPMHVIGVANHFEVAFCRLLGGDFERGWSEYHQRPRNLSVPWTERDFGCPAWDGRADLGGRSVLLHGEQGLGDGIQFARYATEIAKLGAKVVLEVHPPLITLLAKLPLVHEVLPFKGAHGRPFDYHCELMSLPHLLRGRVAEFPSPGAYLSADRGIADAWAKRMAPGTNVGIAWTGNLEHIDDARRSMPLVQLLPHLRPDIRWWCVQKDVRDWDKDLLARRPVMALPDLGDFADTAGLVANLDAVICVDTSVAHLAAALGRPTLILLPYAPEWRWLLGRSDTPWYESVTLFRQPTPEDWQPALRAAMRHLDDIARAGAKATSV
jgi:tetratricopeptide (TPR) repeat protein